jgi:hypothetical protein
VSHQVSATPLKLLIQQIHPHVRVERDSGMGVARDLYSGDPDRPLAIGAPLPRVNPRCSASELHVVCSGAKQSSDAEIALLACARSHGLARYHPKI